MKKNKYTVPEVTVVEMMEEDFVAQSLGGVDLPGTMWGGSNIGDNGEIVGPIESTVKYQGIMDTDLW